MIKCSSCNKEASKDYIKFPCPNCGKVTIVRCERCREMATEYKCTECGFTGP